MAVHLSSPKRVRRDELHSPSPASSPGPDMQDVLRATLDRAYAYTFTAADDDDNNHGDDAAAPHSDPEEETELRLFAAPANAAAPQPSKIRLSSPGAAHSEPGLLVKKPRSYYFARQPTADEQHALHAAAIDGHAVLELSKDPWPGCALPWKVRVLPPAGTRKAMLALHPSEDKTHKRARKGKKTRIAIRKKLQATRERQEAQAKLVQEKEEADREKRTRRNREKKLKKRAKGQAKKLAVEGGGGGGGEDAGHVQDTNIQDTNVQDRNVQDTNAQG